MSMMMMIIIIWHAHCPGMLAVNIHNILDVILKGAEAMWPLATSTVATCYTW